jgi:two-component system sensor histidine kinase KdpD
LISNAAKFSPPGAPIEVVIGCHGTWADVSVLDQGPGIAEADVALAFRKYGRLGSSHRGLGIGLYLARGITRAHGGEVCYRRRAEPTGSIFNLRLPRGGGPLGLLPERDL